MPLPAGFKVNGSKISGKNLRVPPGAQKIITFLDKVPFSELLTTMNLALQLGLSVSGSSVSHPVLAPYHEKVDGKRFWGSRKSIAQLRKQLSTSEEYHAQDSGCDR